MMHFFCNLQIVFQLKSNRKITNSGFALRVLLEEFGDIQNFTKQSHLSHCLLLPKRSMMRKIMSQFVQSATNPKITRGWSNVQNAPNGSISGALESRKPKISKLKIIGNAKPLANQNHANEKHGITKSLFAQDNV